MRRRNLIACVLLVALATGTETIVASTDCDRWIAQYRQALEHSAPVHRLVHAKHALAAYWKPKPRLLHTAYSGPGHKHLTPQEALNRFHVLCGDLPSDTDVALLPPVELVDMVPSIDPGPGTPDNSLIAMVPPSQENPVGNPTPGIPVGGPPGVVIPGVPLSPSMPFLPVTSIQPNYPTYPGTPITPVAPTEPAPVPEPGPAILVATGLVALPFMRRRR